MMFLDFTLKKACMIFFKLFNNKNEWNIQSRLYSPRLKRSLKSIKYKDTTRKIEIQIDRLVWGRYLSSMRNNKTLQIAVLTKQIQNTNTNYSSYTDRDKIHYRLIYANRHKDSRKERGLFPVLTHIKCTLFGA